VPFAGIALLWFIGVVRDQHGGVEDRLFSPDPAGGRRRLPMDPAGIPAWVLLLSLVILFDRPLSHDSHPPRGS
jgi:hypothetical protein